MRYLRYKRRIEELDIVIVNKRIGKEVKSKK